MTTLPASLAARFSSFAAIAALVFSTALATGCAHGADVDGTEDADLGTTTTMSSEQTRTLTPPLRPIGQDVVVLPRDLVSDDGFGRQARPLPQSAPTAKPRMLGEGVEAPNGYVAAAPHQLPNTHAKPTLRKMGEPIEVPSAYVVGAPQDLPSTAVPPQAEPTVDHDYELPTGTPELDLEAACDRDGNCPSNK